MKVGFTGTQQGMTDQQKAKFAYLICNLNSIKQFHHGLCIGADTDAHQLIEKYRRDIQIIGHPPIKTRLMVISECYDMRIPDDYLVRNKNIVNETQLLIATPFTIEEQLRSGTWSTVRYARKLNKPICIIQPTGSIVLHNYEPIKRENSLDNFTE